MDKEERKQMEFFSVSLILRKTCTFPFLFSIKVLFIDVLQFGISVASFIVNRNQ